MGEKWKIIPGHTNYAASSLGRIRRETPGKGTRAGKIRSTPTLNNKYKYVDMWEEGVHSRLYVHQAVLLAFKGPPPTPQHEGAHWDGDSFNNTPGNLRWATNAQNNDDKRRHKRIPMGSAHASSKLTEKKVLKIRQLRAKGATLESLAKMFDVEMTNIDFICRRKTWKHVKDGLPKILSKGCWRKGEDCHKAKLTEKQVINIRKQFAGGASIRSLERKFNVSWGAIEAVCKRKSWKHI